MILLGGIPYISFETGCINCEFQNKYIVLSVIIIIIANDHHILPRYGSFGSKPTTLQYNVFSVFSVLELFIYHHVTHCLAKTRHAVKIYAEYMECLAIPL